MPRVFISDKLEPTGLDLLKEAGLELDNRPGLAGDALQEALQNADGMVVRSGTRVTAELLQHPGKLKAIVRAGVGVDNIDVAAATRRGIVVMNTPGANAVAVAELTIGLMLALARKLPAAMMFVPSIAGISHHWSENTADEDLVLGAQVFADGIAEALRG